MKLHFFALAIYTVLMAAGFVYLCKKNHNRSIPNTKQLFLGLFLSAFLLRLLFAFGPTAFYYDVGCFKSWSECTTYYGLNNLYFTDIFLDYPPGYMYILYFTRLIGLAFSIPPSSLLYTAMIKLPAILTDLAAGVLIYRFAKKQKDEKWALFFSAAFLFAPVVIYNSSVWGQIDSFYTFFIVLSIYFAYQNKTAAAAVVYAYALLTKPQALLFGPVLLFYILQRKSWKEFLKAATIGLATMYLLALPFSQGLGMGWLVQQYMDTFGGYQYFTVNAYNAFMLMGLNWKGLSILPSAGAINPFVICLTFALCAYAFFTIKHKGKFFYISYIFILMFFTFCTMMHERYVYPAFLFLLLAGIALGMRGLFWLFLALQGVNYLNVAAVLENQYNNYIPPHWLEQGLSFALMLICAYSIWILITLVVKERGQAFLVPKKETIIVASLTLVYAFLAFFRLGDMQAPQTFYQSELEGEWFVMQFDQPQTIKEIYTFTGIGDENYPESSRKIGNDFGVFYLDETGAWQSLGTLPESYVFQWKKIETDVEAFAIKIVANKAGQVLNEIVVKNPQGQIITGQLELSRPSWGKYSPYLAVDESHMVAQDTSYYSSMYFDEVYHGRTAFEQINGYSIYETTYFDEVYHGRTAFEQINGYSIYETTHPPLGKVLIEIGILLFGMTPFGWRFIGTLAGVLMVPLMYALAKTLFENVYISFAAAFLFAFDFMHYTQTRIATVDTFVVLFVILTFLGMAKYSKIPLGKNLTGQFSWLLFSGIFMGCAIATKWNGAYPMVGLALFFFISLLLKYKNSNQQNQDKKIVGATLAFCFGAFVFVPILVYIASYFQLLTADTFVGKLNQLWQSQINMFQYHSTLEAEHFFASPWYSWLYMGKPIWYSVERFATGMASSISAFGNPLIWWLIPFAIFATAVLSIKNKDKNGWFILLGYFSSYLPWVLVSRLAFIYHYFPATIFGVLAICYVCWHLIAKNEKNKVWLWIYLTGVLCCFVLFFPVLSGVPVRAEYLDALELFPTWYFH